MLNVVLIHPEIPPNTGNVIRLCANTGATLHLVEPLGFELSAYRLRRAGMDYAELATVKIHKNWVTCRAELGAARLFALTTKGERWRMDGTLGGLVQPPTGAGSERCSESSLRRPASADFRAGDALIFGCETSGLPPEVLADIAPEQRLRLPMVAGNRSINLSNAVAITVYEAWRQLGFAGAD